ncbi:unnamed protein product, partial [Closterium sp. NIES-53]
MANATGTSMDFSCPCHFPDHSHSPAPMPCLPVFPSPPLPSSLLPIAEQILSEFLAKATGTSMDFVEMPGVKVGAGYIGKVTIACGGPGVAARAAGLVLLPPSKAAELLKDRVAWLRECRRCDVLGGFRTPNGGTVELVYTQ